MTFFWMIEKNISTWLSQDACTGVWIMMAFGYARASRSMAAWPRWSEPLSTMTNTRDASLYRGWAMTWPITSMNGAMPVLAGVAVAGICPGGTSRAASRASAPWRSYSCSTRIGRRGAQQRGAPRRPRAGAQPLGRGGGGGGDRPPPLADGVHADAQVRRDPGAGPAAGGGQHDLRPQPVPVRRLCPAGPLL